MIIRSSAKHIRRYTAISILTIGYFYSIGQGTPTIFDCLGAKRICNQIYKEDFFPMGEGNFTDEVNPNFSCLQIDNNAIWYTFITHASGNLGFQITPNNSSDDLNWGLFDITNNDCRDIFSNPSMLVSCNSTGGGLCNGRTGADNNSLAIQQEGLCGSIDPASGSASTPWNVYVPVLENNLYALMISDASSGSSGGFEIDFGLSDDVMLRDDTDPEIRTIETDKPIGCIPNKIFVRFTENLKCESISPKNFILKDDLGRNYLVDLDSGSCNLDGEYDRNYVLALSEPLPAGREFLLEIEPSVEHPMLDLCGNSFAVFNYNFETTIKPLEAIDLPSDTSTCENSLTLEVKDSNANKYLWNDGSNSSTKDITSSGLYNVTVSNSCERVQTSVVVSFEDDADIIFTLGRDTVICGDSDLLIDSGLSNSNFNYEWSDGERGHMRRVNESGNYTLKIINECGKSATSSIEVDFRNIEIELGPDTTLCTDDGLTLDVSHPNALSYEWSSGDTTPIINISEAGIYSVVISNECETRTDEINIRESNCTDCRLFLPNIISRSAVGNNANFKIHSSCKLETYHLQIYDRWGSILFETNDQTETWSGPVVADDKESSGIYVYQLLYSYVEKSNVIKKQIEGDILLID